MSFINPNFSPLEERPSYTQWKNNSVRSVNWNSLPATRTLKWHEISKIRNIVSTLFLSLSALAAATFAATTLTIPIAALASLAIGSLSIAFLATGIYLRRMKDHELDPDFRMKARKDIKIDFYGIPNVITLNSLVARAIITSNEKQALLHQDIYATDYDVFVTKHGQRIFDEIDNTNMSLLKAKFLDYLNKCEIPDAETILQSHANRYFNLTIADLEPFLPKLQEQEEVEKPSTSMLTDLASKASAYVIPTVKCAVDMLVPSTLKAAGQYAMASAQLAYQGKTKSSMLLAANAATCLLVHTTKAMLNVLYPEASQVVNQQMKYEKALNNANVG